MYEQRQARLEQLRGIRDPELLYQAVIRYEVALRNVVRVSTEATVTRFACAALAQDRDQDEQIWSASSVALLAQERAARINQGIDEVSR